MHCDDAGEVLELFVKEAGHDLGLEKRSASVLELAESALAEARQEWLDQLADERLARVKAEAEAKAWRSVGGRAASPSRRWIAVRPVLLVGGVGVVAAVGLALTLQVITQQAGAQSPPLSSSIGRAVPAMSPPRPGIRRPVTKTVTPSPKKILRPAHRTSAVAAKSQPAVKPMTPFKPTAKKQVKVIQRRRRRVRRFRRRPPRRRRQVMRWANPF